MTPTIRHIRTAARERIERLSRRDMLIMGLSAVAMKAADVAFDKLVVDPVLDRKIVDSYRVTGLDFGRLYTHGNPLQQAAFEAWKAGQALPWFAETRSTMTYKGPDGEQWIDWQGEEAALLLWGMGQPRNIPMRKQADPAFGSWAEKRLAAARNQQPHMVRITGRIMRANGQEVEHSYSILHLPYGEDRVLTTSASWPKTGLSTPRHEPTTHSREPVAGRVPRRFAST